MYTHMSHCQSSLSTRCPQRHMYTPLPLPSLSLRLHIPHSALDSQVCHIQTACCIYLRIPLSFPLYTARRRHIHIPSSFPCRLPLSWCSPCCHRCSVCHFPQRQWLESVCRLRHTDMSSKRHSRLSLWQNSSHPRWCNLCRHNRRSFLFPTDRSSLSAVRGCHSRMPWRSLWNPWLKSNVRLRHKRSR
jgi:hypothetical protein